MTDEPSGLSEPWERRAAPWRAVLAAVTDWSADSPCVGWSAADVVDHVIGGQRDFLAGHGVTLPEPDAADPLERWDAQAAALAPVLADEEVTGRAYDGMFGPTTVGATLLSFHAFDLLVHRWDVARSQARDEQFSDAELADLEAAADSFGEAAYEYGVFATALAPPPDADRQISLLARMGRQAWAPGS